MADNDEFRKKIAPCWRRVYDEAKGNASPEELARLCRPALATFFQKHGCPAFEPLHRIVESFCLTKGQAPLFGMKDYGEIEQQCRNVQISYAQHSSSAVIEYAVNATLNLAFEAQTCGFLSGDAGILLAEQICVETIRGDFLEKLAQSKMLERFQVECDGRLDEAASALFDYKSDVEVHLPSAIGDIALKLAADPSCKKMKAKAERTPKRSTAELVNLRLV